MIYSVARELVANSRSNCSGMCGITGDESKVRKSANSYIHGTVDSDLQHDQLTRAIRRNCGIINLQYDQTRMARTILITGANRSEFSLHCLEYCDPLTMWHRYRLLYLGATRAKGARVSIPTWLTRCRKRRSCCERAERVWRQSRY